MGYAAGGMYAAPTAAVMHEADPDAV